MKNMRKMKNVSQEIKRLQHYFRKLKLFVLLLWNWMLSYTSIELKFIDIHYTYTQKCEVRSVWILRASPSVDDADATAIAGKNHKRLNFCRDEQKRQMYYSVPLIYSD